MNHRKKFIAALAILLFSTAVSSQPIQIYSSGERTIQKVLKTTIPNSMEDLYIKLSPPNMNSPESILKFNFANNTFTESPYNGLLNSSCMWTQFGLYCGSLIDVKSSRQDAGVLMFAKYEPWWEPAGHIAISEEAGDSTRILFSNSFIFSYQGMAIDPVNDSILYAGWRYFDSTNTFQRSFDRGRTWEGISEVNLWLSTIEVNPFNTSVIFVSNYNYIQKSTDGGYTFDTLQNNTGNFKEFVFDEEDSLIYFVTASGLYRADANGNNFQLISSEVFNTIKADPSDGRIIYGGKSNGLYRSVDGGYHWSLYTNLFAPSTNVIGIIKNPNMANTLLVTTSKAVYTIALEHPAASYFPLRVGNTWVYNYIEIYYQSIHKMSVVSETVLGSRRYYTLSGSLVPGPYIRIDSLTGNLLKYSPGCYNGEFLIDSLNASLGDTAAPRGCFGEPRVLVEHEPLNLFGWQTEGKSFLQNYLVPSVTEYARGLGPYRTATSEPPPSSINYILKGCVIDGIVYGDTSLVSIASVQIETVQNFSLSQNFPNPFNPKTVIGFSVPERTAAVLRVYDVLGRLVETIVNETLDRGNYSVRFDATELSGGVYYYRFTAGQFEETKKMIVIK